MKKITLSLLMVSGLIFTAIHASADDAAPSAAAVPADALKIGDISVQEVTPTPAELYSDSLSDDNSNTSNAPNPALLTSQPEDLPEDLALGIADVDLDGMITLGTKIFDLVKAGAPVVDIQRQPVSVVPKGITSWTQLAGWKEPVTKVYAVTVKNLYGATTVDLRLKLSAITGGNYNGKGKYLANVTLVPTQVDVSWGYSVNVSVQSSDAVNAGSLKNPVAALNTTLNYTISTVFSNISGSQDYWVSGNGTLEQLQ